MIAITTASVILTLLLTRIAAVSAASPWMSAASGNGEVKAPNGTLAVTTLITDSGSPVAGVVVSYTIVQAPSGAIGYGVSPFTTTTDATGLATTTLTLGDIQGQYLVQAEAVAQNSPITFTTGAFYSQAWLDYGSNPVFGQGAGGPKAYYPTVVYDANGFSGHGDSAWYKMWAGNGSKLWYITSTDGINWSSHLTATGLTNVHHARVAYDAAGFGGSSAYYRVWYWDTANLYSIQAIRTATSTNGIDWFGDRVISQSVASPLVTGVSPDWNRGSYGPVDVLYQPGAMPNSGANPFDYSYVMYYDGTTGGQEVVGLAYSADGYLWTRYGNDPVLDISSGAWDSTHLGFGTVIDTGNLFLFWYSGGTGAINQGIGYAVSTDGINWDKRPDGSLAGIGQLGGAGSWSESRNYTPAVLYDAAGFSGHGDNTTWKIWRTGRSAAGNYAIGYAGWNAGPTAVNLHRLSATISPVSSLWMIWTAVLALCLITRFIWRLRRHHPMSPNTASRSREW